VTPAGWAVAAAALTPAAVVLLLADTPLWAMAAAFCAGIAVGAAWWLPLVWSARQVCVMADELAVWDAVRDRDPPQATDG
jgi:hypothetical protein